MQKRKAIAKASQPEASGEAPPKHRYSLSTTTSATSLLFPRFLNGVGNVVCVQSGEEALRSLLKDKFAVILLDVLMPGLDGYETAALIP